MPFTAKAQDKVEASAGGGLGSGVARRGPDGPRTDTFRQLK